MTETMHYFALDEELGARVLTNCFPGDWSWQPFTRQQNVETLLLFSPLWCNKHFVCPDINWKTYLCRHQPGVKLISLGFYPAKQHNYIDLLQLPEDLPEFIKMAKACADDWQPLAQPALEMNQKLKRFFDGHGKESLQESFNVLLALFRIVKDEVAQNVPYEAVYRELLLPNKAEAHWQKLINRWQAYYPFFICLPFYDIFKPIDQLINDVQVFFDKKCSDYEVLQQVKLIEKIERINLLLTEAESYVQK